MTDLRFTPTPPRLLSEREAAAFLGVSAITLRRMRVAGQVRHVRPSPYRVGYLVEDLVEQARARAEQHERLAQRRRRAA